jgi:hypothetical protein
MPKKKLKISSNWSVSSISPTKDGMIQLEGWDRKLDGHGAITMGIQLIESGRDCLEHHANKYAKEETIG